MTGETVLAEASSIKSLLLPCRDSLPFRNFGKYLLNKYHIFMKRLNNRILLASLALASELGAQAQVVNFPMDMSADGTTIESISGKSYQAQGALAPVAIDGAKGSAWRLDGYSSYLQAKIDPKQIDGQSLLTFSLWVAPESYPMMRIDENGEWFTTMVGNLKVSDTNTTESGDKGFAFQLGSRGTYSFIGFVQGWKVTLTANEKLPCYQWNHLVVTVDATNKKIVMYNNGKEVATAKCQKGTFNGGGEDFYVGKSYTDVKSGPFYLNTFNGAIGDFAIYTGIKEDIVNETSASVPQLAYAPERYADDILRPSFHGMPSGGWSNETHGAVYYNGKYHVFFQKNPNGPYMARLNWGHIVSDNLYKWEEVKTAVSPGEWYDQKGCWSGCVFTDDELTGGKPNIFYTGVDYARAMISQAKPADEELLNWNKVENNPVVDGRPDGLSDDFRDCYMFRDGDKLYMIVGSSKDGKGVTTLHRYDKATGKWSNDGSIFFSSSNVAQCGSFWEMPSITKIGDKWLFMVTPLGMSTGVRTIYWTGSINSDGTFSADSPSPKTLELSGFSKEGYGLLSPTVFKHDDKVLMTGIVPDKLSSEDNYRLGYAHTYSLPREISLDGKGNLVQKPYDGLTAMRSATSYEKSAFTLSGSQDLSPVEGRKLELTGKFVVGRNDFGFTFFGNGDNAARLTYSPTSGMVKLDVSGIDRIVQDGPYNGIYEGALTYPLSVSDEMKLTVYVDHSIVDIFVNDNYAASVRVFPQDENAIGVTAFCDGEVEVKSLGAYLLDENKINTGISQVMNVNDNKVYARNGSVFYQLSDGNCSLGIYDLSGRCVCRKNALTGSGELALQGRGVHIVKLWDANGTLVATYKILL